jgi:antitoxin component YwqK of YwqJK toxin-antitoxin module
VILINKRIGIALLSCLLVIVAAITTTIKFSSLTQLIIDTSEISINQQGQRVYQNKPFTGEMVSYHDSGKVATADQFVNGRRQGYAKKWFANGLLGYESLYAAGVRDGTTKTWWFNTNLRSHFFYIKGKTEGVGKRWYRSGAKFKKFHYHAGKPVGLQQAWRENGKLFSNFEYRNGRIYGLRKANNCVGLKDEVITPEYYQTQASNTL